MGVAGDHHEELAKALGVETEAHDKLSKFTLLLHCRKPRLLFVVSELSFGLPNEGEKDDNTMDIIISGGHRNLSFDPIKLLLTKDGRFACTLVSGEEVASRVCQDEQGVANSVALPDSFLLVTGLQGVMRSDGPISCIRLSNTFHVAITVVNTSVVVIKGVHEGNTFVQAPHFR